MRDKSSWDENGTIFRGWFREDATAKIWLKIICLVLGLFGIISGLFREDFGTSRIIPRSSQILNFSDGRLRFLEASGFCAFFILDLLGTRE